MDEKRDQQVCGYITESMKAELDAFCERCCMPKSAVICNALRAVIKGYESDGCVAFPISLVSPEHVQVPISALPESLIPKDSTVRFQSQ